MLGIASRRGVGRKEPPPPTLFLTTPLLYIHSIVEKSSVLRLSLLSKGLKVISIMTTDGLDQNKAGDNGRVQGVHRFRSSGVHSVAGTGPSQE